MEKEISFHVGMPSVFCWISANIFGVLNQYISWWAVFLNMFQVLSALIIAIMIMSMKKIAEGTGPAAHNANFFLTNIVRGRKYNNLLVFCLWVMAILIVLVYIGIIFTLGNFPFSQANINFDTITMILTIVFTILTAYFLTLSVRKIGKQR
ncbi:hypothetical protein [Clostridium polynesiense]|uniref:hypothetical protein n=1 Tax=Clostridium polynesiense TaxID=1325933 RepID=UPI00058F7DEE|nr:hypothetical protein [Clostridium polynesiense]